MNNRFAIDKKGFFGKAAVILLLLSAVLKGVSAFMSRSMLREHLFETVEFILPVAVCIFYALSIILFGKKGFFLSVFPFIGGVLSFIMRLFSYDNLLQERWPMRHVFLSVLVYLIILAVYSATVSGGFRTKWLLPPLFLLAVLYHTAMEIVPVFTSRFRPGASEIIAEASVYLLLFGLLAVSLGLTNGRIKGKPVSAQSEVKTPENQIAVEEEKEASAAKPEEPEVIVVEDIPELMDEEEPAPTEGDVSLQTEESETTGSAEE